MKFISILTLLTIASVNTKKNDHVTQSELSKYVTAVNNILNYGSENKFQVDMNMYHGIFLMNVFLNRYWNKPLKNLPLPVRNKLYMLMKKQQYLRKHFDSKVKEDEHPRCKVNKRIYTLMNDEGPWVSKLKKFRRNAWDEPMPSDKKLEELYSTWDVYSKNVMDVFNFKNTSLFPRLVAKCLENIAHNPRSNTNSSKNCTSSNECRYLIENEVDFGYIVTHKLVVLQNAHYARGCYIYSKGLDEELVKRFCQTMYAEAIYIGKHDKENLLTDLHMEQIMLCGLEGYADFLKKSWISPVLKMQHPSGCIRFRQVTRRSNELKNKSKDSMEPDAGGNTNEWEMVKVPKLDAIEDVPCNVHTTGVALGTLTLAIRYILDSLNVLYEKVTDKPKNVTSQLKANKKQKTKKSK